MPRYLGIDYGKRRIGLAVSDEMATLASPLATLPSTGSPCTDALNVIDVADRERVEIFVVGLPLNMDGSEGPQAKLSRAFADGLRAGSTARTVELWDERLSSFAADQLLDQTGLSPAKRKKRRDQIAAQVILQSYLDSLQPPEGQ
ncbi:MAG: Holliday junction resolvase RuvX [Phycisphaerae bacterium]|nr:Holliday junction resolvase RuvX [Phycisphaerae bacterium]